MTIIQTLPPFAVRAVLGQHATTLRAMATAIEAPDFEAQSFQSAHAVGQLRALAAETDLLQHDIAAFQDLTSASPKQKMDDHDPQT